MRERARQEILSEINTTVQDGRVIVPDELSRESAYLMAIMLDAYHRDDMAAQALEITEAALGRFPDMTIVVRNHGRALEELGRSDEALEYYRRALWCPDADDTSATWLGNELHNRDRHVDAIEAYLCACRLDPDDAAGFAHVADEISLAMERIVMGSLSPSSRPLPESVSVKDARDALIAAVSCRRQGEDDVARCAAAARRLLEVADNADDLANLDQHMSMSQRLEFVARLYGVFRSELTQANVPG